MNRLMERLTIRVALLLGFGLMLGLWLFAGYQVTQRMAAAQQEAAAANARYLQAQDLLSSVRLQVLGASVLVRDALLDPEPGSVTSHRREIERAYQSVDDLLAGYVPFLDSAAERERVTRLREEISDFRSASDEVLSTDSSRWPQDARLLLRRFMPKREAAIRVSEEVQALNRGAFIEQQSAIAEMHGGLQRQVWTVFGAALAISLVIGWLASRHGTRLEHRLKEQRAREEQIAADLQRLSARLVQAQEDEQRRIARELHDEVGQALSAVKVQLTVAQRRLDRTSSAADLLSDAEASADSALRTVRDLSRWLHPSALDDLGLVAALDSQIADFRRRHRVAIEFMHEGVDRRQHPDAERAIYRIVQEALTNIARHAQASAGRVVLHVDPSRLRVSVEDNGVGFDVADAERPGRRRGLGLLGIRERAAQMRGTVRIESAAGKGTMIEVELPRRDPARGVEDMIEDAMLDASLPGEISEVSRG